MGKYDVSLKDLGLDDLVAAHPVTVATTFEPPEPPPVRKQETPKPEASKPLPLQDDQYASLRSYVSRMAPLCKWGHYLSAGAILVSLVQNSTGLLVLGFGGLMLSIVAFTAVNLLRISLDAKDSPNKIRS
jgi:hypothetical protein